MKQYIYDKLMDYQEKGELPFHMPGHKRKMCNGIANPYAIDITEIDGFDDLHDPQEMIRDSMEEVRQLYGTCESYYLVNGSTSGLLTAVSACCRSHDRILMARNCHKAVYHAVQLLQLEPVYIPVWYHPGYGIFGGVDEQALWEQLHSIQGIKAVVITSPTYEGVVSDIQKISKWTSERGIPLIVDEAHGAHLRYHNDFPASAVELGADLVIQSLHKTLPSLTQTAMLHRCSDLVEKERVTSYLSIYQSSSPSYLFLASMEYAIAYAEEQKVRWEQYVHNLQEYRERMQQFQCLKLIGLEELKDYGAFAYDPCKFVICIGAPGIWQTGYTGKQLKECIREEFQIQLEMAERNYAIAMTSVMDEREDMERLYRAFKEVDDRLIHTIDRSILTNEDALEGAGNQGNNALIPLYEAKNELVLIPGKAADAAGVYVRLSDSIGAVSRDYVYLYPPGIPVLVPGERIQSNAIQVIQQYLELGFFVKGIANGKIRICVQKTISQQKDML